jgi:16S rRNA (cytosine967-C5)-methyltransferase
VSVDPVRDAAVDVLLRVFERNDFLDAALDRKIRRTSLSERGRRFLAQLVYGTVRHKLLCDHVLAGVLDQPADQLPRPIHAILRMGVFQALFCAQVTFPAMVHTSVNLAKARGHAGTARLVNAVLRRVPQRIEDVRLPDKVRSNSRYLSVRYSIPVWMVDQWTRQFGPDIAADMCMVCADPAPLALRVNTRCTAVEALIRRLEKAGCRVEKRTRVPEEVTVLEGAPLRSKLFEQGFFLVQDPASMLVAHLLEPKPGEKVLDMCAAPGGKTTHLAQLADGRATVVAMDNQIQRAAQIAENVLRLDAGGVSILAADGYAPPFAQRFDAILVDAPCTGLGTLRRHPDLKWRAQPEDARRLAEVQRTLLRSAFSLCENNGRIVYSVCTTTPEETDGIRDSAGSFGEIEWEDGPEWLDQWKIAPGTYRILPLDGSMDAFYLMRLRKRS